MGLAEGANVGDDAGATIRVDAPGGHKRAEGHAEGHSELPGSDLEGERMSASERLAVAARYWFVQARGSIGAFIKAPGGIYHVQPESLAQHDKRVEQKAWVPEGYEGKLLGPLGVAHHQSFGKFGMVTGYAWKWLWTTPLAFYPTLVVVFTLIAWIRFS